MIQIAPDTCIETSKAILAIQDFAKHCGITVEPQTQDGSNLLRVGNYVFGLPSQAPAPKRRWSGPTSFQATDCVVINREAGTVLLGKKAREPLFRFIGGFVDPKDKSLELAAVRERIEEAGIDLECSMPEYAFSFRVADPRSEGVPDKIMTAVFICYYLWGKEKAGDDIAEVKWFTKHQLHKGYKKLVMPEHHTLVEGLIQRNIL